MKKSKIYAFKQNAYICWVIKAHIFIQRQCIIVWSDQVVYNISKI